MHEIYLPAISFEYGQLDLLNILNRGNVHDEIIVDFRFVSNYSPSALITLRSKLDYWRSQGKVVNIRNHLKCSCLRYIQRMDFFSGRVEIEENFRRHNSDGKFVPIRIIDSDTNIDETSTQVATCIAPELADSWDSEETGFYDYIEYAVSELSANVMQHSRGMGYICAQYYPSSDLTRIAIADTGIGILSSFQETGSPYWNPEMSDLDAIQVALRPEVSSRIHLAGGWGTSPNAGVGLSILCDIASKTAGTFLIASGRGVYANGNQTLMAENYGFQGTLCSLSFQRKRINNFNDILHQSKVDLGLIGSVNDFNGLFR